MPRQKGWAAKPKKELTLEQRLWAAADQLHANTQLTSHQYSKPVLGLIFLRFADHKFTRINTLLKEGKSSGGKILRDAPVEASDYQARGALYLPEKARYSYLLRLPEGTNIGRALDDAMRATEEENTDLKGALPKTYSGIENSVLVTLLKAFSEIPVDVEGDAFGRIYEYFLGEFARTEGSKGGEFFTPDSIVRLIVEIIEPFKGKVYDPACGSGGMFVASARFITEHQNHGTNPMERIAIYGQEKTDETVQLAKMNLAIHALAGSIKQGNTFYEDLHDSIGKFDFVMANPPFNVSGVDKERIKSDPRYSLGIPSTDNANYLWIQHFYRSLSTQGRAGFVMANTASDARGSELEIRKKIIEAGAVDVMVAVGSNFFYTVTLSCTLWFLDRGKAKFDRKDKILFIDAREIFTQVDKAHRKFTPEQIQQIADIVRSYRGEAGAGKYKDIKGLCKVATTEDVVANGYSLNPGRYVGVADQAEDAEPFADKLARLSDELKDLFSKGRELEGQIETNLKKLKK